MFKNQTENLFITQADKGGSIVILNKKDYIEKMDQLLNDENTNKFVYDSHMKKKVFKTTELSKKVNFIT